VITARGSDIDFLANGGIPVKLDAAHPIAHSKVVVIDGETIITGSYNYTEQAKRNAENALFLTDKALAKKYLANWDRHEPHCLEYEPSK
jgi:phosphatidylserine/phosphatidylglycerophosphate/cardiolipin synthase-like enzyme